MAAPGKSAGPWDLQPAGKAAFSVAIAFFPKRRRPKIHLDFL
jgi:hypothetical protein